MYGYITSGHKSEINRIFRLCNELGDTNATSRLGSRQFKIKGYDGDSAPDYQLTLMKELDIVYMDATKGWVAVNWSLIVELLQQLLIAIEFLVVAGGGRLVAVEIIMLVVAELEDIELLVLVILVAEELTDFKLAGGTIYSYSW